MAPSAEATVVTPTTLTFEWAPVADAKQYGYQLFGPENALVEGGVITDCHVSFTDLAPDTDYTLEVRTFVDASDPDKDSSLVASFTAKTAAQTPLQAPVVTVNTSSAIPTAKWELVENADYYEYTYSGGSLSAPATGTVTDGKLYLRNLFPDFVTQNFMIL